MKEISLILLSIGIVYQLSQIISESSFPIFRWLRNLEGNFIFDFIAELTSCFLCTSVWVGCIVSIWIFDIGAELGIKTIAWFASGLFYSSVCWFLHCWEVKNG